MKDKEHWLRLCELAAFEQDPEKLLGLVNEINRLLLDKEERLKANRARHDVAPEKYTVARITGKLPTGYRHGLSAFSKLQKELEEAFSGLRADQGPRCSPRFAG